MAARTITSFATLHDLRSKEFEFYSIHRYLDVMSVKMNKTRAKNIWIHSQSLDQTNSFGQGPQSVVKAIEHLGYVQIDTISVVERCHHHILYNRIPHYKRQYLKQAQSVDKTIFEYWTHALSYVPTSDFKYFVNQMKNINTLTGTWLSSVAAQDYKKVKTLLTQSGPISIRDIKDDIPIEKTHAWGSTKPSKKALQLGFYKGDFVVSERDGMLKKYDLTDRHFEWKSKPSAVKKVDYLNYLINRSLKSQGIISLDSVCYLNSKLKQEVMAIIDLRIKRKELVEINIESDNKTQHWANPETIEKKHSTSRLTHILSPFDPLIIQRKKVSLFFDYQHVFEAYIPKEKRKFGYFTLPVLIENNISTLLDLKTDRLNQKLLINNWLWLENHKSPENKIRIENELQRFEKFQLGK